METKEQDQAKFFGRLTEEDMDMLERWIGKGPTKFTLLYAITRDGCNAATFHQKCDHQGPTVTVLYNPQGSIYGGYASISWKSSEEYQNTTDAFLFQLRYIGLPKRNKFMLKESGRSHSAYFSSDYGPYFGSAPDLRTFYATVNNAGGYFHLNGHMKIGKDNDSQGIPADEINNGTMNVTELEVYKVTDGLRQKSYNVWRKSKHWTSSFLDELKEEINSFTPVEESRVTNARILMIGPVGAGKSSFYNTITSVFRGRITRKAASGSAEHSLTCVYTPYRVKCSSGECLKFRLCDTRGLEETSGFNDVECNYLLDGNIHDYYQFGSTPISPKNASFRSDPTPSDQIHTVVFVLDSTTLDVLSSKLVEKMKGFQVLMNNKGIPQLIVLTKIDKLCKDVQKDVSVALKSPTVEQHVDKAAQLLGLPRGNVLPVKNYENETELDENINILVLLALREILHSAEDFLDNLSDQNEDLRGGMDKVNEIKDAK